MKWDLEYFHISGIHARKSLLLHLQNEDGNSASSEIAPLPGWSFETLLEAEEQVRTHLVFPASSLFPSVYFGISTAFLDVADPLPPVHCPSHCLLMGENLIEKAEQAYKRGFRVAKLKLGDKSDEEAHALIHILRSRFTLRIDLNRCWSLQRSLSFFSSYEASAFDYVEEPVKTPMDLPFFPYPFALDETLREPSAAQFAKLPMCKALILKPTLLGDITPFLKMHPRCILSSSFEGPVGIGQIAKLAKRHNLLDEFHGLDTLSY